MRKKILFAVMALLVMATGKIWAEGEGGTTTDGSTAYVVLCEDNSLHFLCSNETLAIGGTLSTNGSTISKVWSGAEVLNTGAGTPGWQSNNSSVTSVVIDNSFASARPQSCYKWFMSLEKCTSISGMGNLNTFYVTNMSRMFYNCSSLGNITFDANFSTFNVTDMSYMFAGSGLTSLDLSNFNTSNVTNMGYMFYSCRGLKTLNGLSNFNTSNVTNMSSMFYYCIGLTSLNLSSFNTSKVTTMSYMFYGCSNLQSLNLSSFDTSKVPNMQYMFKDCSGLTSLTLGSFDMSNVSISNYMFDGCTPSKITINGNAFVFVKGEDQKKLWEGFNGLKLVVDGVYDGDVVIDSENYNDAPLIFSRDFTAKKVTFKRSFAAGKASTIFLPFAISSATADYKLYEYDAYKDGIVKFKDVTETETTAPNKPYLLVPNKTLEEITVENATISATTSEAAAAEEEGFFGVYKKMVFTAEVLGGDYDYYGWTGNTDRKGEFRKAGEGAYVNACRAYIKLKKVSGNNAPARLSIELGDGTTGIGIAKSDANGGAEAPVYNLQGQRVSGSYKGVVIKNGKKMIVK